MPFTLLRRPRPSVVGALCARRIRGRRSPPNRPRGSRPGTREEFPKRRLFSDQPVRTECGSGPGGRQVGCLADSQTADSPAISLDAPQARPRASTRRRVARAGTRPSKRLPASRWRGVRARHRLKPAASGSAVDAGPRVDQASSVHDLASDAARTHVCLSTRARRRPTTGVRRGLWKCRHRGRAENARPPCLGNLAENARFPHSHKPLVLVPVSRGEPERSPRRYGAAAATVASLRSDLAAVEDCEVKPVNDGLLLE